MAGVLSIPVATVPTVRRPAHAAALTLMALLALQVAILIPSTILNVVPQHDLMLRFQFFYAFYEGWYFNGQLPQWFHFMQYGEPSSLIQVVQIPVFSYPIGLIAGALKIENALSVFNFIFVVEHCIFLVGIWLLSSRFYSSLFARAVVCCSIILCVSDFLQPYFNFYFFYLFPNVLYYVSLYSELDDSKYLSRAAVIGIFAFPGGLPYGVPIQVLCALIYYLVLTWNKSPLRPFYSRAFWFRPSLALAILALACCVVLMESGLAEHVVSAVGRSQDGASSLAEFLDYGHLPLSNVGRGVLMGTFALAPGNFYVPLGGLLGLLVAGAWIRDRRFWALYAMAALLALMALGGAVAHMAFYFPGMKYFRHLSLLWGFWKLPALLAAGFALEALLAKNKLRRLRWNPIGALVSFGFIFIVILEVACVWQPADAHPVFEYILAPWPWLLLRAFAYSIVLLCILFAYSRSRLLALVLGVAIVFDAATFQASILFNLPYGTTDNFPGAFAIHPQKWLAERTPFPATEEGKRRMALLSTPRPMRHAIYNYAEEYVGESLCAFPNSPQILMERVKTRLKIAAGRSIVQDPILARTFGCQTPILQISRAATFVADEKQAIDLLRSGATSRIVEGRGSSMDDSSDAGIATLTKFSPAKMTIHADVCGAPAILFVALPYHSGWKATVNGNERAIQPADVAVMAIPLNAGPNEVKLSFDVPLALWASQVLGVACIFFALLFARWLWAASLVPPAHAVA